MIFSTRKPKTSKPSLRDRLSENFLRAFEADFAANGVAAIEALRQKSPEKYSEIAARLIAASEPKPDGFESCNSMEEIGLRLLKSVGADEYTVTDDMVQAAIEANDNFIVAWRERDYIRARGRKCLRAFLRVRNHPGARHGHDCISWQYSVVPQFLFDPWRLCAHHHCRSRTSSRSHRWRWTSRSDLGERWPSRLVATAAEDRLSFWRRNSHRSSPQPRQVSRLIGC
jgi:hypothetical protein